MRTKVIEHDLVIDDNGRILGRLERWDIPHILGKRCPKCDQLIPTRDWELHQEACHTVGWGSYHSPLAKLQATRTRYRTNSDRMVAELAALL